VVAEILDVVLQLISALELGVTVEAGFTLEAICGHMCLQIEDIQLVKILWLSLGALFRLWLEDYLAAVWLNRVWNHHFLAVLNWLELGLVRLTGWTSFFLLLAGSTDNGSALVAVLEIQWNLGAHCAREELFEQFRLELILGEVGIEILLLFPKQYLLHVLIWEVKVPSVIEAN
jgi:hypothetical protein